MEPGNLKVVNDLHKSQNRAAAAVERLNVKSAEEIIPVPIPVRKGLSRRR